ncbi:MAG TPA: NADH-quinone oxidoreductase subunit N [Anaerolineaceae bacterium]|nr:NADH-quinone oxidoreductase subunit N [Anaerolineaceae bacterium]
MSVDPILFLAILPEIGLVILGGLVLLLDLVLKQPAQRWLGWVTAIGLWVILAVHLVFGAPHPGLTEVWGGMLRWDWMAYVFQGIFLLGASLTALFGMDWDVLGQRGEFYLLALAATMGMCLMAASADLVMLFLAIETTSIPLYALSGFLVRDYKSTESGFKYMLYGATTSAVMLYGFSLIYGFTGTTRIYGVAEIFQEMFTRQGSAAVYALLGIMLLVLVGVSFKASAAPFHFWAPDVYEGAPTPVAGFLSTASKAAGFAVLMRFVIAVLPPTVMGDASSLVGRAGPYMTAVLALIATLSMIIGNVLALTQKNIKRLLAYSSIAQAGYILIGVTAGSSLGQAGAIFYLGAYLVTNLAAFGIVSIVGRVVCSDEISAYAGLSRRSPGLALGLLAAFLSLGGIPPFGGFVGKVLVFAAAIDARLYWLAILGIINSVVGLYYYLTVLKTVYLYRSQEEDSPLRLTRPWVIALAACVVGILLTGTFFGPLYQWSQAAAAALFSF